MSFLAKVDECARRLPNFPLRVAVRAGAAIRPAMTRDDPLTAGPADYLNLDFGRLLKHHTYDGLGRLVRTPSICPRPRHRADHGPPRSERFYYDGIRRVQELSHRPCPQPGRGGRFGRSDIGVFKVESGESNPDPRAPLRPLKRASSATIRNCRRSNPVRPPGWTIDGSVAREYIWGPGDSYAGVDELLVQFDERTASPGR